MALIWVFVAVLLLVVEAITVQLVSIWFAIGAFLAVIPVYMNLDFTWQLAVFVAGSFLTLLIGRPIIMKMFKKKQPVKTNLDATVGKVGVVIDTIDPQLNKGRIFVDGLAWKARSRDKNTIAKGRKVRIERISGVTALVSVVNE